MDTEAILLAILRHVVGVVLIGCIFVLTAAGASFVIRDNFLTITCI